MEDITKGVEKVTQAVNMDNAQRFQEAVQLYNEANSLFLKAEKNPSLPDGTRKMVSEKRAGYSLRINQLEQFISQQNNNNKQSNSIPMPNFPVAPSSFPTTSQTPQTPQSPQQTNSLEKGLELIKLAVDFDHNGMTLDSISYYEQAIPIFKRCQTDTSIPENTRKILTEKLVGYQQRLQTLKSSLKQNDSDQALFSQALGTNNNNNNIGNNTNVFGPSTTNSNHPDANLFDRFNKLKAFSASNNPNAQNVNSNASLDDLNERFSKLSGRQVGSNTRENIVYENPSEEDQINDIINSAVDEARLEITDIPIRPDFGTSEKPGSGVGIGGKGNSQQPPVGLPPPNIAPLNIGTTHSTSSKKNKSKSKKKHCK